ncbi:hypothetical protein C6503_14635 [Candidatus Poribacteria bacterium]|nr:MAG: hypothetical protein C6503_14635 [Candidatus Poribacteria bacterium]
MKRTFERLAFFILGGIFVSIGYLLSGADTTAAPRKGITLFDTIACKKLIVHNGDPAEENISLEFGDDGAAQLYLSGPDENNGASAILFEVAKDGPFLEMWHGSDKGGTISLSTTDNSAMIQTSTRDREDFAEGNDLFRGAIIGSIADSSSIVLEGKTIETQPRLR